MKRKSILLLALPIMAMLIFSGCTGSGLQNSNDTYSSTTSQTTTSQTTTTTSEITTTASETTATTSETTTSETTTSETTASETTASETTISDTLSSTIDTILTPQEALDALKFFLYGDRNDILEPVNEDSTRPAYRYKQATSFYLAYDSYNEDENGKYHLIHEFEIVIDYPETGEGHTVTYNWYHVNDETGEVTAMFAYDEEGKRIENEGANEGVERIAMLQDIKTRITEPEVGKIVALAAVDGSPNGVVNDHMMDCAFREISKWVR